MRPRASAGGRLKDAKCSAVQKQQEVSYDNLDSLTLAVTIYPCGVEGRVLGPCGVGSFSCPDP